MTPPPNMKIGATLVFMNLAMEGQFVSRVSGTSVSAVKLPEWHGCTQGAQKATDGRFGCRIWRRRSRVLKVYNVPLLCVTSATCLMDRCARSSGTISERLVSFRILDSSLCVAATRKASPKHRSYLAMIGYGTEAARSQYLSCQICRAPRTEHDAFSQAHPRSPSLHIAIYVRIWRWRSRH